MEHTTREERNLFFVLLARPSQSPDTTVRTQGPRQSSAVDVAADGTRAHGRDRVHVRATFKLKVLNPEVCLLLQSAAVRHMFAFSSVSRLGEEPLQGSEDVLMCCHRGAGVLRATVRWSPWHRERVPFVKKITPRAPTKPNTQKPARLAIL
jgi:hypothetical protein